MEKADGSSPLLPPGFSHLSPTPPVIPPNVKPKKVDPPRNNVMISRRPGVGTSGRRVRLEANHYKVSITSPDQTFYQYNVSITYEDKSPLQNYAMARKVMDKLFRTYASELAGKTFAYDGEKILYTVGPLPQIKLEFTVVLQDSVAKRPSSSRNDSPPVPGKRSRHSLQSKAFIVQINYAARIPLRYVSLALKGAETRRVQDALRVLDIILRQQAANRNCLLVKQSFFHDDSRMVTYLGAGISGLRGFHSSFHQTQNGLSLNMDVTTTMVLTPGPLIKFLLDNQGAENPGDINWDQAKRMLKNMRIRATHTGQEFKITGLSEKPCIEQSFLFKMRYGDGTVDYVDITVYNYFQSYRDIDVKDSAFMPCIDVGKPGRPNYLPAELCDLVSLQRYKKALSSSQRASLLERSRQKPLERKRVLNEAVRNNCYDEDPLLSACGLSVDKQLTQFDGRVLEAPRLKVGNGEDCIPRNGRWNFNNKHLLNPTIIKRWAVVNFSARCDVDHLSRELIRCARNKGIVIEQPYALIEEEPQRRSAGPSVRVEKMFEQIKVKLPGPPQFFLCVLPQKKNSDIYGPWKKKCLSELGVATQCVSPIKINDQYLTNVLLKINSKLGGTNSLLAIEHFSCVPIIKDTPTMILGMDVSHGSPGRSDVPSIAAVVGSQSWPLISRYGAIVRTQPPKAEIIEGLFEPSPDGKVDDGIIRELLVSFYQTSNRKPTQIIVFRDGISESQFNQVLGHELDQVKKAYEHLGQDETPRFTVIVAQKNHHTKLFQAGGDNNNVPPGTVVDTNIVHPGNYDFYMCAQAGTIGTSRPAHYHVLVDEIGFSPDDLQNLIHSLSYVYQRSTSAISIVAPITYAHLAAAQMAQLIKYEDVGNTSSGHGSPTSARPTRVPQVPKLHRRLARSMFFC